MNYPLRLGTTIGVALTFFTTSNASYSQTVSPNREVILNDSILPVSATPSESGAYISSNTLTPTEQSAQLLIYVSLPLRNISELQARVDAHDRPTEAVLSERYYPQHTDYQKVATWLSNQGLSVGKEDICHTFIPVSGTVAQLSAVFKTTFAKVMTANGDVISAITPPSLPAEIGSSVLAVIGLQPHLAFRTAVIPCNPAQLPNNPSNPSQALQTLTGSTAQATYANANGYFMTPSDIRTAFSVPSNLNGAGQTVAIIMDASLYGISDVNTWCSWVGSGGPGSIVEIPTTPGLIPPSNNSNPAVPELYLDVEAVAGIAPNANIRIYECPVASTGITLSNAVNALSAILNDIVSQQASIQVVSMSFGQAESNVSPSILSSMHAAFLNLTAHGVTVVASSGDYGAWGKTGVVTPPYALGPEYPASDPYVTAVGGTTIHINDNAALTNNENNQFSPTSVLGQTFFSGWSQTTGQPATGGGVSSVYSRPSWQVGNGTFLAAQTGRCVPDICGPWGYIFNHSSSSEVTSNVSWIGGFGVMFTNEVASSGITQFVVEQYTGTSLAAPVMAAFVALVNQQRGNSGAIGFLNPYLYQVGENYGIYLNGTYVPWQGVIDLNNNTPSMLAGLTLVGGSVPPGSIYTYTSIGYGYSPTSGYDCASGLGYPNISNLANILSSGVALNQPLSQTISSSATTVIFSAFAEINPFIVANASYQWYRNGSQINGATGPQYSVPASSFVNGDQYYCQAFVNQTSYGYSMAISSQPATLNVISTTTPGHLSNLSTRGYLSTGSSATAGFVVTGSGSEPVLIRANGPALNAFGLTGLPDPTLTLNNVTLNTVIDTNASWGGSATLASAFTAVGAFSWSTSSHDDAILCAPSPQGIGQLSAASYTGVVTSQSGANSGTYLIELYDANGAVGSSWNSSKPQLINVSTLANVGNNNNTVLVGGFVIGGNTSATVLIRASGPGLTQFGLSGVLADPQIVVTPSNGSFIVANEGWNANPLISSAAAQAGAFAWSPTSNDSAVVETLPPGNYTATVSGATNDTGMTGPHFLSHPE